MENFVEYGIDIKIHEYIRMENLVSHVFMLLGIFKLRGIHALYKETPVY